MDHSDEKTTLSATDEIRQTPDLADDTASSDASDCATADDNDNEDEDEFFEVISLPPAHHQLLSSDGASFEALKGYDHTREDFSFDDDDDSDDDGDESSYQCCRQKLSAVKEQGGGSWLLGFARLADAAAALPEMDEDETDDLLLDVPHRMSLDSDECSSSESSDNDDNSLPSEGGADDDSSAAKPSPRFGVSFSSSVKVQPIPHSSTLSLVQRRKMFATSDEVRRNRIRNKKEYRYEGCDWRGVTEEWEMSVDMVTGELVHPAHEVEWLR